ncbi:hypothetical protein [Thermosporothrix hazakensis]|uniref:hypothetical protein n=1 Tax=Thermosporothrix hazakensis TaxID=644383 RepID=UPI001B88283D|nr:hypothetical protein [Thermosporothrix hazakensis]
MAFHTGTSGSLRSGVTDRISLLVIQNLPAHDRAGPEGSGLLAGIIAALVPPSATKR